MNKPFSPKSEALLIQAHPDLVKLFRLVNESFQCTILTSARTKEEEAEFIAKGLSHTANSKHLIQPDGYSHAVDVAPDPVDFERKNFELDQIYFAGYVLRCAEYLGIDIRYGGDWNRDNKVSDTNFKDLDHFELK